jgi:hypothetical protein
MTNAESLGAYAMLTFFGLFLAAYIIYFTWLLALKTAEKLKHWNDKLVNFFNLDYTVDIGTSTNYNTNYNSYTRKKSKKLVSLLAGEMSKPPSAEFFGRVNGTTVSEQGKLEEYRLIGYEMTHWKKQKEREDAQNDGKLNENGDLGFKVKFL